MAHLRAITATALLVEATKTITVGSALIILVPHAVEALLNSHHTQHFSVSRLTSYEVLLLTAPHITLLCCNNLSTTTLFPSITNEVPHNCLTLKDLLFLFFKKFIYFIYLFLAALGLRCCERAFSSCGERGLLFDAVRGLIIVVASLVKHGL